jgi:allantoinase
MPPPALSNEELTPAPELVLRGDRVALPDGERAASVHVRGGRIVRVAAPDDVPRGVEVVELGRDLLLPGLVDTHVHVNAPGREQWEGFESATRAAAAGGVTTVVDMPLNSVPAVTAVAALERKVATARGRCLVDVGFWGGVVPGNTAELRPLREAGVLGFKCFLSPSGVDEFPHVGEAELREALPAIAGLGVPLLVHAEDPAVLARAADAAAKAGGDPRRYSTWLATRPAEAEVEAVSLLIRLARETGARVHVVHLAAAEAIPLLRRARAEGVRISAEACPHYLHFAAEEIGDGATALKCAPPIRERAVREALWRALGDGETELIASDHSPCPPEMKDPEAGDFLRAWGGISSLQLGLPVVWRGAVARDYSARQVAAWMSAGPARLAGLAHRKGAIAPGRDADLVRLEPDAEWDVRPERLHHRHPVTPYAGERLRGVVRTTWLRGRPVYEHDSFPAPPRGELLLAHVP